VHLCTSTELCTGRTAHTGSKGIALLFLDHGTRRGEGSASRPGRSLPPGKSRYPLYSRLGGPQGQSGQMRNISPPPGFDPRTVQPVDIPYTEHATRPTIFHQYLCTITGHAVAQIDEVLHYKSEGRGFNSRCGHWNSSMS